MFPSCPVVHKGTDLGLGPLGPLNNDQWDMVSETSQLLMPLSFGVFGGLDCHGEVHQPECPCTAD